MATSAQSEDKKGPGATNNLDTCTICHELFKSITEKTFLPCAHYFHKACIDQWLAKDDSCPICRSLLNEDTTPATETVYPDGNVANVATTANATFSEMREPQRFETGTNNLNLTGRKTCINCHNCEKCYNCINCRISDKCKNCTDCHNCDYCLGCSNCRLSDKCKNCTDCHNCDDCLNCTKCYKCDYCENCTNCHNCTKCYNCTNCRNCTKCNNCTNCHNLDRRHNIINARHF